MQIKYFVIAIILLIITACEDHQTEVKPLNFDVASSTLKGTLKTTFAVGDTIQFNFTGDPDLITFYSGNPGNIYANRNRTTAGGISDLSFSSVLANGKQPNSLQLLVSTDYKGLVVDPVTNKKDSIACLKNLRGATWTDITQRAVLSTGATTTAVPSGSISLSDFNTQAKPVFIAFKYLATAGTAQSKWTITALNLKTVGTDGVITSLGTLAAAGTILTNTPAQILAPGWGTLFDVEKDANRYAWVYAANTSLTITGATTSVDATNPAEAWTFMGPVDLNSVSPNLGVDIKSMPSKLPSYNYTFTKPGVYTVTFVAANQTISGRSEVVKEIQITVQ